MRPFLVSPHDSDKIARAIRTIINDSDLRGELSRRGRPRGAEFPLNRYRERVDALYGSRS